MKAEISKKVLGKMLSRESTESVIQEIAVQFATWKHNHPYTMRTKVMWDEIYLNYGTSISKIYKYWINNIYKPKDEE